MKWLYDDVITWDIICDQNHRFSRFWRKRDPRTDRPTNQRTRPLIEMRKHLKTGKSMILIANNDVSCNHIIIQSFHHHEDASLALWALFLDASSHLYMRVCPSVGPSVRPSVGPLVGHAFVKNKGNQHFRATYCHRMYIRPSWSFLYIKFSISCIFHKSVTYGRTDGPTDGRTDTPSYRDARTHLKTLNFMHFLQKRDIRTDGRTDRRTDRPTDGHTLL